MQPTTDPEHMMELCDGFEVGMRCSVEPGDKRGEVKYVGPSQGGLPLGWWIGVQYDEPVGKNAGTAKGGLTSTPSSTAASCTAAGRRVWVAMPPLALPPRAPLLDGACGLPCHTAAVTHVWARWAAQACLTSSAPTATGGCCGPTWSRWATIRRLMNSPTPTPTKSRLCC